MTPKDMHGSAAAQAVETFYRDLFRPGDAHIWTAADLNLAADEAYVHFTGQCFETTLEDGPSSLICRLDLATGGIDRIASGRLFRQSCRGHSAYVAGHAEGENLVINLKGAAPQTLRTDTRIEDLRWSPDGRSLLVVAADSGADVAGVDGGFALRSASRQDAPYADWLPDVTATNAQDLWRRVYLWSETTPSLTPITRPPTNVWEAAWLGCDALIVIASDHHSEGSWYQASLRVLDARTGEERSRHQASDQIAVPAGAPDAQHWAAIEAFCSDRGLVCGTVILADESGHRALDLEGVEATDICWRNATTLLFSGLRGSQTVVGEIDVTSGERREIWVSDTLTIGGWAPRAIPIGKTSVLAVIEGYSHPPAIARLFGTSPDILANLTPSPAPSIPGAMQPICWQGRDGLPIDGWLVLPNTLSENLPLFIDIHGGPVSAHRNRYAAALRAGPVLVAMGYALLLPNPRGSSGRGQAFARLVKGDVGGEDMQDYLAGIDHLISQGLVDPKRLAVSGTSYGGYMSARLVTQTRRFSAAVPISPIANWYSQHFASQIPWFDEGFLDGSPCAPGGQYFDRSPAFAAAGATTPTLVLAGGRDKTTPASQAVEFYGALSQAGVDAALAVYPQDGHSLRGYPAYLDSAARIIDWFEQHI